MTIRILEGHILDVLAREPAGSIHCAVTSPPYLWLRAYGTEPQVWPDGWVGELGQEESPERYVQHLVAVMEAVKRVLRDDGTLWVNLAGCYFNDPGGQNGGMGYSTKSTLAGYTSENTKGREMHRVSSKAMEANAQQGRQKRGKHPWLKALDWVDMPGLFAHAMQAAGWLWRSDVVWVKPSALPESVSGTRWERCKTKTAPSQVLPGYRSDRPQEEPSQQYGVGTRPNAEWADCPGCPGCPRCAPNQGYVLRRGNGRPTKSTERVLLFIKRSGAYFDSEAVREASARDWTVGGGSLLNKTGWATAAGRNDDTRAPGTGADGTSRNLRDWWVLSPEPLADEHYAAYPTTLPTRCIKAGTSERGCCPGCGAPWARVMAPPIYHQHRPSGSTTPRSELGNKFPADGNWGSFGTNLRREDETLGWRPTCRCPGAADLAPVPCRVLDPFAGSGTTLIAADRLGRDAVGVELKSQYVAMAQRRVTGDAPLLLWGAVTVEGTTGSVPEAVPLLLEEPEDAVAGG